MLPRSFNSPLIHTELSAARATIEFTTNEIGIFTARNRSLRRLCFHRWPSVHRGGGECLPLVLGVSATPPGRHCRGQTPPGQTSTPAQCMLGYTPCQVHAGILHFISFLCSSQTLFCSHGSRKNSRVNNLHLSWIKIDVQRCSIW